LILAWYLLHGWRSEKDDDIAIGELLVQELASNQPLLLSPATEMADPIRDQPPMLPMPDKSELEEAQVEED